MFFEYPSESDWRLLEDLYPFGQLFNVVNIMRSLPVNEDSFETIVAFEEIHDWANHLDGRLRHVYRSFIFTMFYYQKGIPDEEWFKSPGDSGESIQYFPNFDNKHFWHKTQFDFYADVFYYKLFSAWDTVGQILNVVYNLKQKRPAFISCLEKLKTKKPELWATLSRDVAGNHEFVFATTLRNDMTHNFLPGKVGASVIKSTSSISVGVGKYTTTNVIAENMVHTLDLLTSTGNIIFNHRNQT